MNRITAAANAIAKELKNLGVVKSAYAYPRPLSSMEFGDLCMRLTGGSQASTFKAGGLQTIYWDVLIFLGGDTSAELEKLQENLAILISTDKDNSLIGKLRDAEVRAKLKDHGSPRVGDNGVEIAYNEQVGDVIATFVQCQVLADIRIGNATN